MALTGILVGGTFVLPVYKRKPKKLGQLLPTVCDFIVHGKLQQVWGVWIAYILIDLALFFVLILAYIMQINKKLVSQV